MKNISLRLATLAFVVAACPATARGQQLGDNATIIVRAGTITNLNQTLLVKGAPKAATTVGNCAGSEVRFQDALLENREGLSRGSGPASKSAPSTAAVPIEVTVVVPGASGFKELKPGWRLGSWRSGGKCGPGYDVYLAHIIAIE